MAKPAVKAQPVRRNGRQKWVRLLEDADVRRWHTNLSRGSRGTAGNYLRTLGRVLEANGHTPASFMALSAKKRDDLVSDAVDGLLKGGLAGSTVAVFKKAVVSWLEWNGARLGRKIKIPDAHRNLTHQRTPSPDELRSVFHACDARQRAATACLAFSGMRPQVLGNDEGKNGLRLRDLVELDVDAMTFEEVPTRIVVPAELSKTKKPYTTFVGPEGCDYLLAYLKERRQAGEELTGDSPVIRAAKHHRGFITTTKISALVRDAMRAAGVQERPYIWRSYYSGHGLRAESKGWSRDYREFTMGHASDISRTYSLGRDLSPEQVKDLRAAYAAACEVLETRSQFGATGAALATMRIVAVSHGMPEEALASLGGLHGEELNAAFAQIMTEHAARTAQAAVPAVAAGSQRTVAPDDVDAALAQGWRYCGTLPNGRVVVEWP